MLIFNKGKIGTKRTLSLMKTRPLCSTKWQSTCSRIGEHYYLDLGTREAIEVQKAVAHTFQGLVKSHPFPGCQPSVKLVGRPRYSALWTHSPELEAGSILGWESWSRLSSGSLGPFESESLGTKKAAGYSPKGIAGEPTGLAARISCCSDSACNFMSHLSAQLTLSRRKYASAKKSCKPTVRLTSA